MNCIHHQITMMKLLLFTMIFAGFEIQNNLATRDMTYMNTREEVVYDCWDMNKCLLDEHCGPIGKCFMDSGIYASYG